MSSLTSKEVSRAHIKRALESTAKWFEAHPTKWLNIGTYVNQQGCCCLTYRFAKQAKVRTGIGHMILANLCVALSKADPNHEFNDDLKYGRPATINDFRLQDVPAVCAFLRELKGVA